MPVCKTAEPLVLEPSAFEVELAIEKLRSHMYFVGFITVKTQQSLVIPGCKIVYNKWDKTDCNNYRGISLLPTTYKIFSNILPSRLIPYAEEVIGDHQCGFRRNRLTTDHIFCTCQILEKKGNIMKQCISCL